MTLRESRTRVRLPSQDHRSSCMFDHLPIGRWRCQRHSRLSESKYSARSRHPCLSSERQVFARIHRSDKHQKPSLRESIDPQEKAVPVQEGCRATIVYGWLLLLDVVQEISRMGIRYAELDVRRRMRSSAIRWYWRDARAGLTPPAPRASTLRRWGSPSQPTAGRLSDHVCRSTQRTTASAASIASAYCCSVTARPGAG